MGEIEFNSFTKYVLNNTETIAERAIAFLYFRTKFSGGQGTVEEVADDFRAAGLGRPQLSKLRTILKGDRRTKGISNDAWIIPSDKLKNVELGLNLSDYFSQAKVEKVSISVRKPRKNIQGFVDPQRTRELKSITSDKHDLSRLLKMCREVNDNFSRKNYISVIILVRTILNHVAPIFEFSNFSEVANNYKCEQSLKTSLQHLENSSRTIADGYLHIPARKKEILPTATQVNFSQDLDVLLGEVVRILKK